MDLSARAPAGLLLEEFAEGFAAELRRWGYSRASSAPHLAMLRHLAGWLDARGVPLSGLTSAVVDEYAVVRRGCRHLRARQGLEPLLGYLRGLGVVPPATAVVPAAPDEVLLARFGRWLSDERGLTPSSVGTRVGQARPFVAAAAGQLSTLTLSRVAELVTAVTAGLAPTSAQGRAAAARALLRFLWLEGLTAARLEDAVGSFAVPAGPGVPRGLAAGQVADLLAAVRAGRNGIRNEPILVLMLRLGLRAGEIAALLLDDLDWRRGVVAVRGKGGRVEELPIPVDVGTPLVGYLRGGRPAGTGHRQVFLSVKAPHGPMSATTVGSVAGTTLRRSGVARGGGHLLRHSDPQVTALYARADMDALRTLARPWPGRVPA